MTTLTCSCGHVASAVQRLSAVQAMADHFVAVHAIVRASDLEAAGLVGCQTPPLGCRIEND